MIYYTAENIIPKLVEFVRLTPNKIDWNKEKLKSNSPRYIRYQRLMSLIDAFGLNCTIKNLYEGHFFTKSIFKQVSYLSKLNENRYFQDEMNRIMKLIPNKKEDIKYNEYLNYLLWKHLLKLATHIFNFKYDISNINAGEIGGRYSLELIKGFYTRDNLEQIKKIHSILGILLDPEQRIIKKTTLINSYNYPDDNLEEIDADWY